MTIVHCFAATTAALPLSSLDQERTQRWKRYEARSERSEKTAVVFRTKVLMKMEIIFAMMTSLSRANYDIWVLFDAGPSLENGDIETKDIPLMIETFERFVQRVEAANPTVAQAHMCVLEADMLLEFYPEIPFHHILWGRHTTIGRYFHLPFINLWRHLKDVTEYKYYWVVEDDARVSGDNYALVMDPYLNNTADLITKWREPPFWIDDTDLLALGGGESKDPFSWSVPKRFICQKGEHVERLSRPLLDHIHEFVRLGIYGYSEVFSSTLCKGLVGCYIHWWNNDGFLGSRYSITDDVVTVDMWFQQIIHNETGKWFHPVKWLGGKNEGAKLMARFDMEPPNGGPMRMDEMPFASDMPWYPH